MLNGIEFTVTYLIVAGWACIGTVARIGLDWILSSTVSTLAPHDTPIGVDFLSNIVGCLCIGALDRLISLKQGYAGPNN